MTIPQFRLSPGTAWNRAVPRTAPATPPAGAPPAGISGVPGGPPGEFRNSRWDRAALGLILDPSWLLAPLYARDVAGLTPAVVEGGASIPGPLDPSPATASTAAAHDVVAASADWPEWWSAALAFRPGTPAPRVADLIAGSAALQALWTELATGFATWLAARQQPGSGSAAASGSAAGSAASAASASEQQARRVESAALSGFADRNGRDPGRWAVRILQIPVAGHYLYAPEDRRIVVSAALRHDPDGYAEALAAELPRHF